jgi:hypothetical protein
MEGFAASHDPMAIGCVSCHEGDPFTLNKNAAHKSLIKIPGNLGVADKGCGTAACHPEIIQRVKSSIMTTNSGMVSVNRWVFDEADSLSILSHISEIGHTAADQHLRDMCAHCHLGMVKEAYGPVTQLSRGGGCNACHLQYDDPAAKTIEDANAWNDELLPLFHPSLTINTTNDHCFGCHSRSGRISMNYEGWHETMLDKQEIQGKENFRVLEDERVLTYIEEDVHHKAGMQCIDCHTSYGVMGDGHAYHHKEQQVKIQCIDCHIMDGVIKTTSLAQLDQESLKIAQLRGLDTLQPNFVRHQEGQNALVNVYYDDPDVMMTRKSDRNVLVCLPPAKVCQASGAHQDISCSACHSSWVPQCIGCHNEFDEKIRGYDLLERKEKEGSWVEFVGRHLADPPALGVTTREGKRSIDPFAPGMVLTIDLSTFERSSGKEIFKRLYSPVSPHTTVSESRSCISCHLDPLVLGYGRGELVYELSEGSANFEFVPRFAASAQDGLPEDAWIGFLQERTDIASTRPWARPFNIEEQKRILTVGACLTCHDENSDIMQRSLFSFQQVLNDRSEKCVMPSWK